MATEDLIDGVLAIPAFARQLRLVTVESVVRQFPAIRRTNSIFDTAYDWSYLLTCAALLARSSRGVPQDAALRIAHHSLAAPNQDEEVKAAACVTLDMLANQPAISLARDRNLISTDYFDTLPLPLRMDWVRRAVQYSIVLGNDAVLRAAFNASSGTRWRPPMC